MVAGAFDQSGVWVAEAPALDLQHTRQQQQLLLLLHCVSKNIPDIFDHNLKNNYQILIIFGRNIPDTTCHQMTIQFPTSANVCFCTTW